MENKTFIKVNRWISAVVAVMASLVYLLTMEPSASFWDCGEFIASSYKLEIGHAPGNPSFNLFARLFTMFTDAEHAALAVNAMSALCSGFTVFFLYLSIVQFGKRIQEKRRKELSLSYAVAIFGAGIVGAFSYCFSDTFWFSAVEAEVYAMSSLFTAVVFWAILKWEEQYGKPYANRWIVLICFLMGISVGVHLLNLLAIPAIVFIYYYKTHPEETSILKCFGILCFSAVILAVILFGIIPYLPRFAAGFDRVFVNGFGLPFNVGAAFFMVLLFVMCYWGLTVLRRKDKPVLHTILICFTTIVIGYSLFTITVIRSSAGTPTNEYQPDNPYTLIRYLGREQYGSNPIVYGQYFTSPYEVKEKEYYTPLNGRYYKASNVDASYPASVKAVFPRMWNGFEKKYIEFYKTYCTSYRNRKATVNGKIQNVQMPKFSDNLKFFFDYQVNYMYVRYFMWNFVGRQNDFHGQVPGDIVSGNWESGIKFLDEARLGPSDIGPDYLLENKGKNHYFFLPLLLGLAGFFYQLKKDGRNAWVTGLLFLLTGLAIIIYLNQPPYQVRERDYAYAGSFYVFTIWIGLGVLCVRDWFEQIMKKENSLSVTSAAVALCLCVPVIMGCQNWDDHDRSGRYTARDLAFNYLNSTGKNAVLVTHGDNDTFPLWYSQEVEGVRTDVRIMNSSLLGTDWYIDQMKCKFYDSEPLNISIPREQYLYGTNDYTPVIDMIDKPIPASEVIKIFKNPKYVTTDGDDFIPCHNMIVPVNKENVIKSGIVSPEFYDRIEDYITIQISGNSLSKKDLIILDFLANYDWTRPLCFISKGETTLGIDDYLMNEGFAYKLVPFKKNSDDGNKFMDAEALYDRLMNVYRFDSLHKEGVNYDYYNLYTFLAVCPVRDAFYNTAEVLLNKGDKEKARNLLLKVMEIMPDEIYPYNIAIFQGMNEWDMLGIIEGLIRVGEKEKAAQAGLRLGEETLQTIIYFSEQIGPTEDDIRDSRISQTAVTTYLYLTRVFSESGMKEVVDELQENLNKIKG